MCARAGPLRYALTSVELMSIDRIFNSWVHDLCQCRSHGHLFQPSAELGVHQTPQVVSADVYPAP